MQTCETTNKDRQEQQTQTIARLEKKLAREIAARKQAERILEQKSREHYETNINLSQLIAQLEHQKRKLQSLLNNEKHLNEVQSSFISIASHEFRTPLAIIDATAQQMHRRADKITEEKTQKFSEKIRTAVKRMTNVIESTLSAAKIEAGTLTIKPSPCDIHKTITDCCNNQMQIIPSHTITKDLKNLPQIISADPSALEQIFTNLLSNAVKYSPHANIVDVKGWLQDGNIYITVHDNGVGIDKEDIPKMFNRFFRAKTSSGIEGTGIGLNLVKMLVEEHGGHITLESIKGEGTMFTLCLPHSLPEDDDAITLF